MLFAWLRRWQLPLIILFTCVIKFDYIKRGVTFSIFVYFLLLCLLLLSQYACTPYMSSCTTPQTSRNVVSSLFCFPSSHLSTLQPHGALRHQLPMRTLIRVSVIWLYTCSDWPQKSNPHILLWLCLLGLWA